MPKKVGYDVAGGPMKGKGKKMRGKGKKGRKGKKRGMMDY